MAASDMALFLVDNLQETFGLAVAEAMAAGLPVVASDWDVFAISYVQVWTVFCSDTFCSRTHASVPWHNSSASDCASSQL